MHFMKKLLFFLSLVFILLNYTVVCAAQVIITFAGTGTSGYTGDGGQATAARLFAPSGVCADTAGNIFIADQNDNCIRKVDASGVITTVAGNGGVGSYTGDGGPATAAGLYWPEGVTADLYGNIYIADQFNNAIRKVSNTTMIISTIAGIGTTGYAGDGGPATAATLWHPGDVGVDRNGNVFFVDQDNSAVRKINTSGIISTVAGNGTSGYSGDGGPSTAAKLNFPQGIAVDSIGNIYVADFYNNRVRRIDTFGIIRTVAGNGVGGYSGDGGPATAAEIYDVSAVAIDEHGNLFISDYYDSRIRKVDTNGIITSLTGTGIAGYGGDCGPATAGEINYPEGVAVDKRGNVYIADFINHRVRKITDSAFCPLTAGIMNKMAAIINVYPNPSNGQFTIQVDATETNGAIEVYNVMGEKVYGCIINNRETVIDLRGMPGSFFYVNVIVAAHSYMRKIIIVN
jgi:trimeric autotransporter adhesin